MNQKITACILLDKIPEKRPLKSTQWTILIKDLESDINTKMILPWEHTRAFEPGNGELDECYKIMRKSTMAMINAVNKTNLAEKDFWENNEKINQEMFE